MSLILKTERRTLKSILIYTFLYLILSVGALTMIYPFILMVSGSFSSKIDSNEFRLIPSFLTDTSALYRKHIESKYNENLQDYITVTDDQVLNFTSIKTPSEYKPALLNDWVDFVEKANLSEGWYLTALGPTRDGKIIQENERLFREYIMDFCDYDLNFYREYFDESIENWFFLKFQAERLTDRKYQLSNLKIIDAFYQFKKQLPITDKIYISCEGEYKRFVKLKFGEKEVSELSPKSTSKSWENFVRTSLHPQFIQIDESAKNLWIAHLKSEYNENLSSLNKLYNTSYSGFEEVPFPEDKIRSSVLLKDFLLFISDENNVDLKYITLDTPEIRWRQYIKDKYITVDKASLAHGRNYNTFDSIKMPQSEFDWDYVQKNKNNLRKRYLFRNYQMVLDYILLYGKGMSNTVIYCVLSILLALLVNPLAAYALSRYNLPSQYKILLFLIATMAFPAVVTMIPNFLLLRDLGLLNTFAALLLPGMANGYSIFLLKGFFDSLPRELYEAAEIDGANEWIKFWIITMNLSKPILAVIALGAFNAAYSNFMYAFILCQDREMWTLMVWLYQLQQFSGQGVVFASLIIAAIPTLLVFICFQNVILRGIVVPTEK